MQFNVLQLYSNDLLSFFMLKNSQHVCTCWIIHFKPIETITQMLQITLIIVYWNMHNNLMAFIYIEIG
jgi:hypothetical protein